MILTVSIACLSGRYAPFAMQLTAQSFGVYAMDWIGMPYLYYIFIFLFPRQVSRQYLHFLLEENI